MDYHGRDDRTWENPGDSVSLAHLLIIIELLFSSCFPSSQKLQGEFSQDLDCAFSMKVLIAQSCWLFVTPWTVALQDPLSMGFPRQEYWSRLPFPTPREPSRPRGLILGLLHCRRILYPLSHRGGFEWNHRLRIRTVCIGWWDWEYSLRELRTTSCKQKMLLREDYVTPQTQGFHKRSRKIIGHEGRHSWINKKHP